jgi:hypothetical protein
LLEDIDPGTEIWIADLAGFGRFATLICADMSHEDPGDFLIHNVDLDWLHTPIMDRTNVVMRSAGSVQPWMIDRATRAAKGGARRVVVTNSALFTSLINVTNSRPGSPFPPYDTCSIAFMVDGTEPDLRYREVEVTMPPTGTVVDTIRWEDGFASYQP